MAEIGSLYPTGFCLRSKDPSSPPSCIKPGAVASLFYHYCLHIPLAFEVVDVPDEMLFHIREPVALVVDARSILPIGWLYAI